MVVLPVAAIVLGHLGVRASNGSGVLIGGKAFAKIGLSLGYMFFLCVLTFPIPLQPAISERGNQVKGIDNCKQIISRP